MEAGTQCSLTCTATVEEYLQATPTLEWQLPGKSEDISVSNQVTSGTVSNRTLTLIPLHTSHGGVYTCVATVTISGITPQRQTADEIVYVQSECLWQDTSVHVHIIFIYLYNSCSSNSTSFNRC